MACLHNLYRQAEGMKAEEKYSFKTYLTDDGSTDGTSDDVANSFPSVKIIKGDGNLFWNQGMRLAWSEAAKDDPDFYLWLNDDTILHEGALSSLMENSEYLGHKAIVVGTCSTLGGELTYGGRTKTHKIITPDDTIPVPCYTFNGNIVLVPKSVYMVLGSLDPRYHHSFGDYDYGVRAVKAGIVRVVAPGILGTCSRNPGIPKWSDRAYSLKERFMFLLGPKGRPPKEQFLYDYRSRGVFYAIGHIAALLLKVLFPLRKGKGDKTESQKK